MPVPQIFTKAVVYMLFVALFTVFAIVRSDDNPRESFMDMTTYDKGRLLISLSSESQGGARVCVPGFRGAKG